MRHVLSQALGAFARADLLQGATGIQRAERIEHHLGLPAMGVGLYLKRVRVAQSCLGDRDFHCERYAALA